MVYTIIVSYNGMKWIDKCLKSVINQCDVVLVVDNNSSDNTVEFIRKYYSKVVIILQKENLGFGKANNVGISYALNNNADAVFLLNQDAYASEDTVEKLKNASINNEEYGIISPVHLNGDGSAVDLSFLGYISPYYIPDLISDLIVNNYSKSIYGTSFINAAAWFIPKAVFLRVGGFDPIFFMYGEDDNFCQRLVFHGFKIGIIPTTKIFHDSNNFSHQFNQITINDKNYYSLFKKNIYIKYANINNNHFTKLRKYKLYIFKKATINFFRFNLAKAKMYLRKYKLINSKLVKKSIQINRVAGANYLNIN